MLHIKNKPLNVLNSTPQCCVFLWVWEIGGGLRADGVVQYNRPIGREDWGGSAPRFNAFNITCWHRGPAFKRPFVLMWLCLHNCWCAFGRPALSDVAMEEVCCRIIRCRRRTSSLTLTLPQSKLVRLEDETFGFPFRAEAASNLFF